MKDAVDLITEFSSITGARIGRQDPRVRHHRPSRKRCSILGDDYRRAAP